MLAVLREFAHTGVVANEPRTKIHRGLGSIEWQP